MNMLNLLEFAVDVKWTGGICRDPLRLNLPLQPTSGGSPVR